VRLPVILRGERSGWERHAAVVDLSLAGAGLETDEPLPAGERLTIAFATPTLWDPLVLTAVVAWAHPVRPKNELDAGGFGNQALVPNVRALGRQKTCARSGVLFDYPTPDATLAMFEMLIATAFE